MPDHLHVIVSQTEDRHAKIGNFASAMKRRMRQELNASWKRQPGCSVRLLRSDESLNDKWLYVEESPVRAGLVKHWEDWAYRYEFNNPNNCRATAPVADRYTDKRALARHSLGEGGPPNHKIGPYILKRSPRYNCRLIGSSMRKSFVPSLSTRPS